jgi:hypothetical protein
MALAAASSASEIKRAEAFIDEQAVEQHGARRFLNLLVSCKASANEARNVCLPLRVSALCCWRALS